MGVFCNNNGSRTNNAREIKSEVVGKTRDGISIREVTYLNSSGETEGYLCLNTSQGERLIQWSGYKIGHGRKVPWQWGRAYDVDYVRRHDSSQLPLKG